LGTSRLTQAGSRRRRS